MKNFLQHRYDVIEDFCISFKVPTYKKIWGIDLNCNAKNQELVWLHLELLKYQELADCKNCNFNSSYFTISAVAQPKYFTSDMKQPCCNVTITNTNYTFNFIQFTIGDGGLNTPSAGTDQYNNSTLKGNNLQVFRNGEGYLVLNNDFSVLPLGGFILNNGRLFNEEEVYTIFIIN